MIKAITFLLVCFFINTNVNAQSALDEIRFSVGKYEIIGDNPIGQLAYDVLEPYIGDQYGLAGLSAASDELERALAKKGFSFHRVNLPPQELLSGSVILEIIEFQLGQVKVKGNKFFDDDNIRYSVPALEAGKTPNTISVSRSIKQANKNGSKTVKLKFNEGEIPDTIDAELNVTDLDPQTYFVSLDNTGGDDEPIRMTLGYQHANVFNRDHAVTLTYSTAPKNTDLAQQIGLNYAIPFYGLGSKLSFLLSDSESNSGTVANNNLVTGKGSVYGINYTDTIYYSSKVDQEWSIAYTQKLFDNTQINTTTKVLSQPLDLGYRFNYQISNSAISGGITYSVNLPSGDDSSNLAYQATGRTNATNDWQAIRYQLAFDHLMAKKWLLHLELAGQNSKDSLISGEQFGVGGSSTLRGFDERSINGDEGYNYRVELWMPAIESLNLRYFIFSDHAHVELKETNATSNDGLDADLASYGLGARWSWKQQLSVEMDYGVISKEGGFDTTINRKDDKKTHLSLVYRF